MNGQHFEKCYVVETALQASSKWMMVSSVAKAWGVVRRLNKTSHCTARSHLLHCSWYLWIAGYNVSAVCIYVHTRRIYKFISNFVGAKMWLIICAVKWYYCAVMGFSHFG